MQADKTIYGITEVCGFEPSGSPDRVHWADYKNKKRGKTVHLQYMHESTNAVFTYLETTSGMRRMNDLRKPFNSRATLALQMSGSVKNWNYKSWKKQVETSDTPHKLFHAIVMISLQESRRQSYKLFEGDNFPQDEQDFALGSTYGPNQPDSADPHR